MRTVFNSTDPEHQEDELWILVFPSHLGLPIKDPSEDVPTEFMFRGVVDFGMDDPRGAGERTSLLVQLCLDEEADPSPHWCSGTYPQPGCGPTPDWSECTNTCMLGDPEKCPRIRHMKVADPALPDIPHVVQVHCAECGRTFGAFTTQTPDPEEVPLCRRCEVKDSVGRIMALRASSLLRASGTFSGPPDPPPLPSEPAVEIRDRLVNLDYVDGETCEVGSPTWRLGKLNEWLWKHFRRGVRGRGPTWRWLEAGLTQLDRLEQTLQQVKTALRQIDWEETLTPLIGLALALPGLVFWLLVGLYFGYRLVEFFATRWELW